MKSYKLLKIYIRYIKTFFTFSKYICNGVYIVRSNSFQKAYKKNLFHIWHLFIVFSFKKNNKLEKGNFLFRNHKTILIGADFSCHHFKRVVSFLMFKTNLNNYLPYLPYHCLNHSFNKGNIYITPLAIGNPCTEGNWKEKNVDYLWNCYSNIKLVESTINIDGKNYDILKCVQHGDFHDGNVYRKGKEFVTVIDLESISLAPLFYDLLYYVASNSDLYKWIEEYRFSQKIDTFLKNNNFLKYKEGLNIDIYVAAFALQEINCYLNEDTPLPILNWLMKWIESFDFSKYPLTKTIIYSHRNLLQSLNYCFD